MADKIYLLRGNDTPMSVCLRKREGDGDPVPYDLSAAERIRLALVGHGAHVFASGVTVSGEDNNIVSGVIPGRALLKGDYDLEVTFRSGGRDKRFAVEDMFEAVDFLSEDADGETEGEGAGIWVNVTVQPEVIEIAGPTGPQGKSAYEVAVDNGYVGTEEEWLASLKGDPGEPGSDADVTQENIETALGYTPYEKPETGIPSTDMTSEVQTSLGKADTALQSHQDITGKADLPLEEVNIQSLTVRNGHITTDGVWISGNTYCHTLVPVSAGKVVRVVASENYAFRYAWLTSGAAASGGIAADLVPGTSRTDTEVGATVALNVPTGAIYMYVYLGATGVMGYTPRSIAISSDTFATLRSDLDNVSEEVKQAALSGLVVRDVDPDAWPVRDYYLNISTGKWGTNTDYKHQEIPVHGCLKVIVKAAEENATIAWLNTSGNASSGAIADLTPGSTGTIIPAGTTVEVTAPADAHYLYIYLGRLVDGEYTLAPERVTVMYAKVGNDYTIGEDEQGLSRGELIPLVDLVAKGENIDLNSLTRYVGFIAANGNSTGSGNGDRFYIPVKEGQHLIIKSAGIIGSQFAWVSQIRAENTNNGQSLYMLAGTERMSTSPDVIWTGTVPAGAAALLVNTGSASYWYGREGMTPKAVYLYNSPSFSDGTGINEVNPESEFRPKMMSARKRYYTSTTNDKQPPLVIAHLSDIHANWPNVSRFLEFAKKYSTFIDELLNTGDTVSDHLSQGIAGYAAIDGAEDILNVIGNHDTRGDGGGNNWRDNIGLPAYNAIIAPFVANWGVTQPEGAAENGYCYFYKDYTAKSIRLVCVDIMAYDSTEDTWLAGVLADALTNGLHVVIATHFAGSTSDNTQPAFTKVPCDYTSLYAVGGTSDQLDVYNPYAYHMMATVDSFMEDGGHFVGYLQGHYHTDYVARVAAYPSQMIYGIGSSKAGETRDFTHTVGTRNQDEFQIVAIDTVNTIVKIFKVGAHIDRYGRIKESVCVNYGTAEVIGVDTTFEALKAGLAEKYEMPEGGIPASDLADGIVPTIATEQPSGGMLPNVVYELGELDGDTAFTLAAATDNTILNHWYWTFDTPSTAPTITWPAAITSWVGGSAPTVAASKHYEVSVIGGVAAFMEV